MLLLLALASPVQALPTTFGDIEITPEPAPKGTSSHGYLEYVFHIVNTSKERAHIVTLSIPSERSFSPGDSIRELQRTVQVGAKESVFVSLLQPDHPPLGGVDVAVAIDGRRQEREMTFKPNESLRHHHLRRGRIISTAAIEPLILLGPHVKPLPTMPPVPGSAMPGGPGMPLPPGVIPPGTPPPPGARTPPGRRPSMAPPATPAVITPRLPPGEMLGVLLLPPMGRLARLVLAWQMGEIEMPPGKPGLPPRGFQFVSAETWSSNWLAYTRYDGIIVTAAELDALPPEIQTALWQYVETGGALLVLGRTELRGLSSLIATSQYKAGWLLVLAGFGRCRVSSHADYETWDAQDFDLLVSDWRNTASVWSASRRDTLDANRDFPVIDDLGVPVKGLFVLMFLFALGIGPVNLFVLSRFKRRIWLLWTTPFLSLCTCVAVFGFMLISEGWEGRLRSETLTFLDETTHRATTIGWTGVYTPLTPSDGLHFRYETEVVPQRFFEGGDGGGRSCTIDWSQDQHFASGWVEARVPTHFKVRKSELRRERVTLQREPNGRWSMVNGLGTDTAIRRFWYADAKGQIHAAENVAPGARAVLTQTEKECLRASTPSVQNTLSHPNWMSRMSELTEHPEHHLLPGTYLAEMDDSPFLEVALPNARMRRLHALVLGFGQRGEKRE